MPQTVVIIGGGAAGVFAAIQCAEVDPDLKVIVLEKTRHLLSKVRISGGGRCNVTHACFEPDDLVAHYPRGARELLGPFYTWQPADTMDWFTSRGVSLKTEDDGRVFPTSDLSGTIIDCLARSARTLGVDLRTRARVESVQPDDESRFIVTPAVGEPIRADRVLLATGGGGREEGGLKLAAGLGHTITETAPSLFTFHIADPRIKGLAGVSVEVAEASCASTNLLANGPVLITHWGLSGPAILKLSARGAREFARMDYAFELSINWLPGSTQKDVQSRMNGEKLNSGRRLIAANGPAELPRRLWEGLVKAAGINAAVQWAQLSRRQVEDLAGQLVDSRFQVMGKAMNKEEFVTCGGVALDEVDFRTMESKSVPGLFFAGEILDLDGLTGGFNLQAAWTTGMIAGEALGGG